MEKEAGVGLNILSLDGGGLKGRYSLRFLERMENESGLGLGANFDLYVGTSIGGIMSVCAALGLSAREIREEFSDFFAPVQSSFDKILPKEVLHFVYLRIIKKLFSRFERIFAKQRFGLISSKVFLPVYNHSDRKNSHFGFGSELNLDDVLISDVVKAICSDLRLAKPYKIIELNRSFSDAGIFAYDPSQYFVRNYIGNTEKKLNILSIGSGIIENLSK